MRLADVARIELGASDYTLRGQLDNKDAAVIGVFQAPGANALDSARRGDREDGRTGQTQFPPGMTYRSDYDTTIFVRDSIDAVVHTLLEAIAARRASS